MRYVINSLKAEIKSLKMYIDYCKESSKVPVIEASTYEKYLKEIKGARKNIQHFRDAIRLLTEYRKKK